MPKCKKCSQTFPNRLTINGVTKNLHSRKYCLSCSPYGLHNTRKLEASDSVGGDSRCRKCGRAYIYNKTSGHSRHICNSCIVNKRRFARKLRCLEYLGGKCVKCGYDKCPAAMHFHHVFDKRFVISGNHCLSWETTRAELDKCVILCGNCHAEFHYEETNATR